MFSATVELVWCEGLAVKCLKINKIPKSVKPRSFRALDSSVIHSHAVSLLFFWRLFIYSFLFLIGSACLFIHRRVSVNLSVGLNGNMSAGDVLPGSVLCTAACCAYVLPGSILCTAVCCAYVLPDQYSVRLCAVPVYCQGQYSLRLCAVAQ